MSHKFRDIIICALGVLAAAWFFIDYAHQEPRSTVSLSITENNAELTAAEILSRLGYSINEYETSISFNSNHQLLDSLQHHLGRTVAIDSLEKGNPNIKPYYWSISFENSAPSKSRPNNQAESGFSDQPENKLDIHLDEDGNLIAFINKSGELPSKLVNRKALNSVFNPHADTLAKVFPEVSDSLLSRLLYFDLEQSAETEMASPNFAENVQRRLQQGRPYQYTAGDARHLAQYYLTDTGWDISALQVDTVFIERVSTENAAKIRFKSVVPILQQDLLLDVQVTPTGSLVGMSYTFNPGGRSNGDISVWSVIRFGIIFLFALAGVMIFFSRIRSRAIDTQSALVVAIIMGLAVSTIILLSAVNRFDFFSDSSQWFDSVVILIQIGMGGATSSIGFFMLFALGDSVARQYWPEKLLTYDYLRRGILFSKPIGMAVLHSIAFGFILTGIWSLSIRLMPSLYVQVGYIFLDGNVGWPPLFMLLEMLTLSLIISLSVFMIIGSQVYAKTKNLFFVSLSTVLASAVILSLIVLVGPEPEQFIMAAILGLMLTFIYLKWDFLTLFLSLFTFLALLGSSSGWVISDSPDWYIFVSLIFVLTFMTVAGIVAMVKGKEEGVLPKYIPEYVEELAQEERIKQELEIARGVQESFLPVKMPEIEGLDIAALCKPAYETGGDYYDVIKLNDHQVAITIGDVSGKGIPAAFYMTFTKGMIHSLCRETDSPAELLVKTNRLFCENARKGTFISLVYGILDLRRKTFTFARAGHNPIIRLNSKTGDVEELQPTGLGIGLTKEAPFEQNIKEVALSLDVDDTLILYTDGIVEALNIAHEFYGTKELIHSLKPHLKKTSSEILSRLMGDVTGFIGSAKQHDDMTVMVVKID